MIMGRQRMLGCKFVLELALMLLDFTASLARYDSVVGLALKNGSWAVTLFNFQRSYFF